MTRRIVIHNEFARALDNKEGIKKVPVRSLRVGDSIGSGEKIKSLESTNDGRVRLYLSDGRGYGRFVHWAADATVALARDVRDDGWHSGNMTGVTKPQAQYILKTLPKPKNAHEQMVYGKLKAIAEGSNDGVGEPEEVAYGEGWHSSENVNPYTSTAERAAWERGRAAKKQKYRMNQHTALQGPRGSGMKRKVSFEQPKRSGGPVNPGHIADFKSEKGYVAKLLDVQTGAVLARSEPYISNGPSLKKWIQEQATDLIRKGKRVKAEVNVAFFDPNMAS